MGFLCTEIFENTLGVWALILSCSYLILYSSSGWVVYLWSPEVMWRSVHWAVVMCMACYKGWLLVFVVCVLALWNMITKYVHKECWVSSFGNFLSLTCFFYIHFAVCFVLGLFYSLKGMLSPSFCQHKWILVSFEYTCIFLPQKDTAQLTHVIVLLFLWIQVQTCASKFHCTAWQQLLFLQAFPSPPLVYMIVSIIFPHTSTVFSFSSKILILFCVSSLVILWVSDCFHWLYPFHLSLPVIAGNPHVIQNVMSYLVPTIWFHYICGLCCIVHESCGVLDWIVHFLCCVCSVYCSPVLCLFCLLCCFFSVWVLSFVFCLLLGFLWCVCSLNLVAWFFIPWM